MRRALSRATGRGNLIAHLLLLLNQLPGSVKALVAPGSAKAPVARGAGGGGHGWGVSAVEWRS